MTDIDEQYKTIYNAYQKAVNTSIGRKFRYRKDFLDFEKENPEKYSYLVRLGRIFSSFPGISEEKYFSAPYRMGLYKDEALGLDFYVKPYAIRVYNDYMASIPKMGEEDVKEIVKSELSYLYEECLKNKIKLSQYIAEKPKGSAVYRWVSDFAKHRIGPYIIVAFMIIGADVRGMIKNEMTRDEVDMYFGEEGIRSIMTLYDTIEEEFSSRIVDAMKKISKKLKNDLTK